MFMEIPSQNFKLKMKWIFILIFNFISILYTILKKIIQRYIKILLKFLILTILGLKKKNNI